MLPGIYVAIPASVLFHLWKNKSTPTLKEVGKHHERASNLPHASKIITFLPFVCFIEALKKPASPETTKKFH